MLTIWPFGPPSPRSPLRWRPHNELCFDWSARLPLDPSKCEASFFSVDPHQAHLQPNLLLLNSRLHFNPTQLFLESLTTALFPFLNIDLRLKAKVFSHVSRPYAVSLVPHEAPLRRASLPPLRVTLTLRLPTSFPISGLARLGVKSRLCRSSWRAFASTHPLMFSSTSPWEALLALLCSLS